MRRYPFILSPIDDGKKFILCLDEAYDGWDKKGKSGQRLFSDDGDRTPYLEDVLKFTNSCQAQQFQSLALGTLLLKHDLFVPMQLKITTPDGTGHAVKGFQAVARNKLKDIAPDRIAEWHKTGVLESIYLHLWSLRKFEDLASKTNSNNGTATKVPS